MDSHTLALLEFDEVRRQVIEHARSPLGKDLASQLAPIGELSKLHEEISRTTEMADLLGARMEPPLGGLRDVRIPVKRASLGVQLEIEPVREIRDLADLTGRAYEYWLRLTPDSPRIERLLSDVSDLRPLARFIDESIDERGEVRSSATNELAQIRSELAQHEARIQKEIQRLLRQAEVRSALRYPQPTMSGDHHVLAVAVNHRHKVAGVVHRTSASGETVYIEPPKVSEISAEMSVLKSAEQREIRRVLRRLSEAIGSKSGDLLRAIDVLAELDLATAKARYAMSMQMTAPEIVSNGGLRLEQARHPLLERIFAESNKLSDGSAEAKKVVPISVHLGGAFDLLVITGPNTGGKTVVLKTVGLLTVMALSGLHIPARGGSIVPMLDAVLADIGDEQSLQQSLSTFSAHVTRIGEILRQATPKTLVLLDELGAGTDPTEGAALGQAILDELREIGAKGMVTTHLGDLKSYALTHSRVENAAVEFDAETLRPTYRLLIGQFGESCALRVARRLNTPRRLLARAYRHLRKRGRRSGEYKQLQQMREETEKAREDAIETQRRAAEAEAGFKRRQELLRQEADVSQEIERFRTTLQPGDSVRVLRFDRNGVIKRIDRRRSLAAVQVGKVEWELPLDDLFPTPR